MWNYCNKQKQKVALLELLERTASDWANAHAVQENPALDGFAEQVRSIKMTNLSAVLPIEAAGSDQTVPGASGRM